MKTSKNYPSITLFIVLSIAVLAFFTYKGTLHRFFADGDSLTLIETNRVYSLKDVGRIFSQPEAYNTVTASRARFFRPVSMLSFSLDYSLWKVNPFGYHLTNIVLHILVSTALFFLLRLLTRGHRLAAWLGACLFVIHPSVVEVVPDISRRLDILVALFHLLSLILFIKYYSGATRKKNYLFLSLVFFALSLWSKEVGVILPGVILGYLFIFVFSDVNPLKRRLLRAFKGAIPYVLVMVLLLTWRTYVVKGLGGYSFPWPGFVEIMQKTVGTLFLYVGGLLSPFAYVPFLFRPEPGTTERMFFTGMLLMFSVLLIVYGKRLFQFMIRKTHGLTKVLTTVFLLFTLFFFTLLFSYPLLAPAMNSLVEKAYHNEGSKLLSQAMRWKQFYPAEYYYSRARDSFITLIFFLMLCSMTAFILIFSREKVKKHFSGTFQGKLTAFLLTWLFLPFGVYFSTLTFSHRCLYIAVIPVSALLALLLVDAGKSSLSSGFSSRRTKSLAFILLALYTSALVFLSPLVSSYGEWKDSAKISELFLYKLSAEVNKLPDEATLYIYDFPAGLLSYTSRIPHAKSVGYLYDTGIKSWIDLNFPHNRIKVAVSGLCKLYSCPRSLNLTVKSEKENVFIIAVDYDF